MPPLLDVDGVLDLRVIEQRSSDTCTQTCCSVCVARNDAAWAQVEYAPIEQIDSAHPHTRSTAPPRIRNPQCGNVSLLTTTVGHVLTARQSVSPLCVSIPHVAPVTLVVSTIPPSAGVVVAAVVVLVDEDVPVSSRFASAHPAEKRANGSTKPTAMRIGGQAARRFLRGPSSE